MEAIDKTISLCKQAATACLMTIIMAGLSLTVSAQEETLPGAEKEAEDVLSEEDVLDLLEEDSSIEEVIVTGSRLKRDSFDSASPLQIISGDISRESGLFDTAEILQTTAQAAGSQVNNSFNTFVLDNGLGSATIGYRGLGADRTLVLLNGRRVGPAGVGGAPSVADLNLIPTALIQRIENVFDGASAVYGSDAVAGVANIILRSDVDGFEARIAGAQPESGGGPRITGTSRPPLSTSIRTIIPMRTVTFLMPVMNIALRTPRAIS